MLHRVVYRITGLEEGVHTYNAHMSAAPTFIVTCLRYETPAGGGAYQMMCQACGPRGPGRWNETEAHTLLVPYLARLEAGPHSCFTYLVVSKIVSQEVSEMFTMTVHNLS